jgi:hypothetical protein
MDQQLHPLPKSAPACDQVTITRVWRHNPLITTEFGHPGPRIALVHAGNCHAIIYSILLQACSNQAL